MDFICILISIALIIGLIILLKKRYNAPISIMCVGLLGVFLALVFKGRPEALENQTGFLFLDYGNYIFQLAYEQVDLLYIFGCVMGYLEVIKRIHASDELLKVMYKVVKKFNHPKAVLFMTCTFTFIVHLLIPSRVVLFILVANIFIPLLMAIGFTKETSFGMMLFATAYDCGPVMPNTVVSAEMLNINVVDYFSTYELPYAAIVYVSSIFVTYAINRWCDKKYGHAASTTEDGVGEIISNCPAPSWYAVLPFLPFVLMILFSDAVLGVSIGLSQAYILSFLITAIIITIRNGLTVCMNSFLHFFSGVNDMLNQVGVYLIGGAFLSAALQNLGIISVITDSLIGLSDLSPIMFIMIGTVLHFMFCILVPNAVGYRAMGVPLITAMIQNDIGISALSGTLPMCMASSLANTVRPISPSILYVLGKEKDINSSELMSRMIISGVWCLICTTAAALFYI